MENQTPQVIVTPKEYYYTRRVDGHADWRLAFWRELFQNSTDAGATLFDIKVEDADAIGAFGRETPERKIIRISFTDNGTGMSLETLRDVFFSPGKSTKQGNENNIGGFGTARLMLCFSQARYVIDTNGYRAEGDGSEYIIGTVSPTDPNRINNGCRFTIDLEMKEGGRYNSSNAMKEKLHDYLNMSQISGKVLLNGEKIDTRLYRGPVRRTIILEDGTPFATVHLSSGKKAIKNKVIVRQNGAAMFSRTGGGSVQIIVEIDPAHSRLALAENRDSLRYPYLDAFESMIRDVTIDSSSALNDRSNNELVRLTGKQGSARFIKKIVHQNYNKKPDHDHGKPSASFEEVADEKYVGGMIDTEYEKQVNYDLGNTELPDIMIRYGDLKEYPKMRKSMMRYDPRNWGISKPELGRVGVQAHQTLAAWTVACRHAVTALQNITETDQYKDLIITTGFTFPKPEEQYLIDRYHVKVIGATSERIDNNRHALLINPINMDGKSRYHLSKFFSPSKIFADEALGMSSMISLAIHETTHIVEEYHGESFATLYTILSGEVDVRQAWQDMQAEMKKVAAMYQGLQPVNQVANQKSRKSENSHVAEFQNDVVEADARDDLMAYQA